MHQHVLHVRISAQNLSEREEQLEKKKLLLEKKINDEVRMQQAHTYRVAASVVCHWPWPEQAAFRRGWRLQHHIILRSFKQQKQAEHQFALVWSIECAPRSMPAH